jgi:hypothetical protein
VTGFTDDRRAPHVKPWRLSPSAAELWSSCPQAFSFQRELGIDEVVSRPLRVGRLMAMTVERYLTHCFEQKVATDVTAIEEIARAVFVEQGLKEEALGIDALEEVIRICGFYVQGNALDLDRLLGVEVWLPPTGVEPLVLAGREVIGKVDQLLIDEEGRVATVFDQKTNWAVWSESETRDKMQAKIYPLLVFHSFPEVEEVEAIFQFIRWPGIERSVRYTRAEAELERQNIEALVQQMQRPGLRPATPGSHCGRCGYVLRCPRFKSARETNVLPVPTTPEEATELAEVLVVLEAGKHRIAELLQGYTKEFGPVRAKDTETGYFTSEKPTIGAHAFVEWAKEHDVDPFDYLQVPTIELRRLMRKRKSLAELTDTEKTTRFDTRRPEEDVAQAS